MEKKLPQVLEILDSTIAHIKTLKESEFDYMNTVSEYDITNECGTVCCVCGWYPKWYPESSFKWIVSSDYVPFGGEIAVRLSAKESFFYSHIVEKLASFHGVSEFIINLLFSGYESEKFKFSDLEISLSGVIKRFERVRKLLASGKMPLDYSE